MRKTPNQFSGESNAVKWDTPKPFHEGCQKLEKENCGLRRLSELFRLRMIGTCLLAGAALLGPTVRGAHPIVTARVTFELEGLDLDTGQVLGNETTPSTLGEYPQVDFVLGYHADRIPHGVVLVNRSSGIQITFLRGTPFSEVNSGLLGTLTFTSDQIDQPFQAGRYCQMLWMG